jgi:glyoxylase-like metal-dependent hydrolase (beta-lactamase superfamily II)
LKIFQIKLKKMLTFCYLVGDETTRTGALIDPAFETKRILNLAEEKEYQITRVINTHCHPDHTSGNASVIAATGAKLLIHIKDAGRLENLFNRAFSRLMGGKGSPKPDVLLTDGDRVDIGNCFLKVLHTPGHTPGSICLYAQGHIFTGDTLFVGGVGRIDLPGGSMKQLLKSIHEKIYTLPGNTIVWPGHDYGSFSRSTVENEKQTNPFT